VTQLATSLLALIDDIATVLDDVSLMTKVAAKKTAGVLGDDLALNAQQVTGVNADRELPVVWAVAKGSFRNKAALGNHTAVDARRRLSLLRGVREAGAPLSS
jgi:predicted DNA repair protein MutK